MKTATFVAAYIHTPPSAFGKVMSEVQPRMAIAYHALLLPELLQESTEKIRATYDGPLTIAGDLMVWNVTKDKITLREAVVSEMPYPPPAGPAWGKAKRSKPKTKRISDAIRGGWWEKYKPPPLPEK